MIAWRLTKRRYSGRDDVLSGKGAKEVGGRWNEPGLPLVYASESASLAILETLVHASLQRLPKSLVVIRISVPDDTGVKTIAVADLPSDWRQAENPECVRLGSEWIRSKTNLVLRVPSATNPLDRNVLLNPLHPDITRCEVSAPVADAFDPRLIVMFESPRS